MTKFLLFGSLITVGIAAVRHFGWLDGLAIWGAVFLLMPYGSYSRDS